MPTLNDLTNRRIKEAEQAGKYMETIVRGLQATFYGLFVDWMTGTIEVKDGKIKYTASNLGKVVGVYRLFGKFGKQYQDTLLGGILERAANLFGLNEDYYNEIKPVPESVADAARRLALQRWGYDTVKKELIPGGYFESLFQTPDVARNVAALVNRAIGGQMSLIDFQKQFRRVFIGPGSGNGMLEKHWKTNSFDLFQKIDRAANLVYADRLGFNYAIYSGTVKDTTRPWCEAHVNKVLSREEIKAWTPLKWKGKRDPAIGYDPFLDCGDINCRHHWSFVSDTVAEHLRPELKKQQ